MTLLEPFINYLQAEKRYSELTVKSYRADVERFLDYLEAASGARVGGEAEGMTGAEDGTASACEAQAARPGREVRPPQPVEAGRAGRSPQPAEAGGGGTGAEAGESIDPRLVTPDDIRSWIASLARTGKLKASSINKMVCSVRAWFHYLLRTGAIDKDPFLKIGFLKTGSRLPVYLPETKMAAVVDNLASRDRGGRGGREQAEADNGEAAGAGDLLRLRNEAIVVLLYSTGIRLAELIAADRGDLSDGLERLKVRGKGDKERVVPLIEAAREKLAAYLEAVKEENICTNGEKSLFLTDKGSRITRTEVYRLVSRELGQAGVSGKRSPHVLRHTFATHMLDHGAGMREIQELLGHSSLGTTQIYTHNSIARLKEVYKQAHPRGKK